MRTNDIFKASEEGDLKSVQAVVEAFESRAPWMRIGEVPPVSQTDRHGQTPLFNAVMTNQLDVARYLIGKGADINARDHHENTPLHFIPNNGKDMASLLIQSGANVNIGGSDGRKPLHNTGSAEIAQVLLDHGATVDSRTKYGETPLHLAACHGVTDLMKTFIQSGADVNATMKGGDTPLHHAVRFNEPDAINLLIEHGAKEDLKNSYNYSPRDYSTMNGQYAPQGLYIDNEGCDEVLSTACQKRDAAKSKEELQQKLGELATQWKPSDCKDSTTEEQQQEQRHETRRRLM